MRHYHDVVSDMKLMSSVMSKTHSVAGIQKTPERDGGVHSTAEVHIYHLPIWVIHLNTFNMEHIIYVWDSFYNMNSMVMFVS